MIYRYLMLIFVAVSFSTNVCTVGGAGRWEYSALSILAPRININNDEFHQIILRERIPGEDKTLTPSVAVGANISKLAVEELVLWLKKYGNENLNTISYVDSKDGLSREKGGFFYHITAGDGKVTKGNGAWYCNYLVLINSVNNRSVIIHTNNDGDVKFAKQAITKALEFLGIKEKNRYMAKGIILTPQPGADFNQLAIDVGDLLIRASKELGISELGRNIDKTWGFNSTVIYLPMQRTVVSIPANFDSDAGEKLHAVNFSPVIPQKEPALENPLLIRHNIDGANSMRLIEGAI